MKRKIAVITGSRAEFGLLQQLLRDISSSKELELQLVVTGAHLEEAFGKSVNEIEAAGFPIVARVPLKIVDDTPIGAASVLAEAVSGIAKALQQLQPDLVLVLGDRYEILGAASAAMLLGFPIAHLCGGDVTAGAFDESIRHAITKISHIHFVTNSEARRRLIQMGELPSRVHDVGSPGLDTIRKTAFLSRSDLEADLGCRFGKKNLLVAFHPVTRGASSTEKQQIEVVESLLSLDADWSIFITMPNADPGNASVRLLWKELAKKRRSIFLFETLGSRRFLSLMKECDLLLGNSSSGLYEAPFLKKPSIDIGDRQEGRIRAGSVLHVEPEKAALISAINLAAKMDVSSANSPYGDGKSSSRIISVLEAEENFSLLLKKSFFDGGRV